MDVYPNPFNSQTTINYKLESSGHVSIKIFNTLGQQIKTIKDGYEQVGKHELKFGEENLPSGLYLINLIFEGNTVTKKIVVLK